MKLPPNTNIVPPDHKCDICRNAYAKYYHMTWYIHFCSPQCFERFMTGYAKEIDQIALKRLSPDNDVKKDGQS